MNLGGIRGWRFACLLSLTMLMVCGCTVVDDSGSSATSSTLVRVIDATYNSQALDAYVSSRLIATNFAGPSISNYAFLPPGAATIKVVPTGKSTTLAQVTGTLAGGQQHSAYITGQGASFQMSLLNDQNTPSPTGSISIRFLQQAVATGAVDLYLVPDGTEITAAKPVVADLDPGTITAYISVPAGTTTNAYTSAPTVFSSGQVKTALIVDSPLLNAPPVDVLLASDLN